MRSIIAAALIAATSPAFAQAQKPVTSTLSAEQNAALNSAIIAADFWLMVRGAAAANSTEGRGFALQRAELQALMTELGKQEAAPTPPPAATESKP